MNNNDIQTTIQNIRKFFEIEVINKDDNLTKFSEDVITTAYQKLCQSLEDVIQNEDDPMVINELLSSFLNTEKMINDRNIILPSIAFFGNTFQISIFLLASYLHRIIIRG